MFTRKLIKQNKFKRFLLRLLNIYAYDKETLNIVNPHYQNDGKNYIDFNNKSFNFANGYLDLKRKIKQLDIYFRYSPENNLWNSSDRWKRIIPDIDKKTLISVCLISLNNAIDEFLKKNDLKVNLHLIADNSNEEFDNLLIKLINSKKIDVFKHNSKIKGNRGSYLECCDQAEKAEDLIFFVEDDYLFEEHSINECLLTYSRICSLLDSEIILCPSDYPFFYDSLYKTSLFIGNKHRWRNVGETLLTFMYSKSIFNKYKKEIREVGEKVNEPFEKPLHGIYKNVLCLAPIKSLSYHISRAVPDIGDEWKKIWDINYAKLLKFKS